MSKLENNNLVEQLNEISSGDLVVSPANEGSYSVAVPVTGNEAGEGPASHGDIPPQNLELADRVPTNSTESSGNDTGANHNRATDTRVDNNPRGRSFDLEAQEYCRAIGRVLQPCWYKSFMGGVAFISLVVMWYYHVRRT